MTATNGIWLRLTAAAVSLGFVVFAVARVSSAAFSDTTDNGANDWHAASVQLSDDDSGSVLFASGGSSPTVDSANMVPGTALTNCIAVTYDGSVDSNVKFYGTVDAGNNALAPYLNVTVERGTATTASFGTCGDFSATETVFNNTLNNLPGTFATGGGTWAPTGGSGETVYYRFQVEVADNDTAQDLTAAATFTWESQTV